MLLAACAGGAVLAVGCGAGVAAVDLASSLFASLAFAASGGSDLACATGAASGACEMASLRFDEMPANATRARRAAIAAVPGTQFFKFERLNKSAIYTAR